MKKLLIILTAILSSGWFTPVTFAMSYWLVGASLCSLERCQRTYTLADIPRFNCTQTRLGECEEKYEFGNKRILFPKGGFLDSRSPVAVYLPSNGGHIEVARISSWPDIKFKNPDASLMLPVKNGQSIAVTSVDPRISVVSSTPTSQTILAYRWGDFYRNNFMYETDGITIRPIKSELLRNASNDFITFWSSLFLAIGVWRTALWWRDRLLRRTAPA